ncbi:MAG TPA: hypothetical protein VL860_01295, partial [Planctomycetota bacterium]|nr:hypothetical protein [Planctomycetota bacterium]
SYLAARHRELNGVNFYDRTLRLFIGRVPVKLSDLFDAPAEFRRLEAAADFSWRRQLCDYSFGWQKAVLTLRRLAGQDQAGKARAELRVGLLAVIQLQFDNIARQQELQHQYECDVMALATPALAADQREAAQKRVNEYPETLRKEIEGLTDALEAAWTDPMEKAFVGFYERTKRIDFVRENLHDKAKGMLAKPAAQDPANGGGPGEHPDQF